jgi:hypothetical protein
MYVAETGIRICVSNYSVVQSQFEYAEFVFQTKALEVVWKNSKKRVRTRRTGPLIISRSPKLQNARVSITVYSNTDVFYFIQTTIFYLTNYNSGSNCAHYCEHIWREIAMFVNQHQVASPTANLDMIQNKIWIHYSVIHAAIFTLKCYTSMRKNYIVRKGSSREPWLWLMWTMVMINVNHDYD